MYSITILKFLLFYNVTDNFESRNKEFDFIKPFWLPVILNCSPNQRQQGRHTKPSRYNESRPVRAEAMQHCIHLTFLNNFVIIHTLRLDSVTQVIACKLPLLFFRQGKLLCFGLLRTIKWWLINASFKLSCQAALQKL